MLHGPGHFSEDCKVLKVYSEWYATQRRNKKKETRSCGKPKRGKVVEFDDNTHESNVVQNDEIPIPRKKKGTNVATKKCKIKIVKSAASEQLHTYGIDSLNLSDTEHTDNDYVRGEENSNGHDSE